jgi:hypothetical protein
MKTCLLIVSGVALSLLSASAAPKTEVTDAIRKLAAQSGYAWTYTPKTEGSESGRRQGPIEGKTEKDGFTHLKSSLGDVTLEIGIKGTKMVVNYNGDWLSTAELGENNRTVQRLRMLKKADEEAADLLAQATELKKESDGSYASSMAAEAAKNMFALLGKRAAESPDAKGSMKFWIKDGMLSKYEYVVRGKITVGEDKKEVEVIRTTTVEIKDVGAVKVSLPEDAKKKLS